MMQPICVRPGVVRVAMRSCRIRGPSLRWPDRAGRRYVSGSSPPSPPPRKKPAPKPLPFKPTQPRATPPPPPGPSSANTEKRPVKELLHNRWIAIFGAGAAALCLGLFTSSLVFMWTAEAAPCYVPGCEPEPPTGRPSIQSPYEFDSHLDKSEWKLGITNLRRRIASEARGHVLEVALGTGRNLEFYDWGTVTEPLVPASEREKEKEKEKDKNKTKKKAPNAKPDVQNAVLSYTGVDISPGMLDIALLRMRQIVPHTLSCIPKKPSFAMLAARPPSPAGAGDSNNENPAFTLADNRIRIMHADAQSFLPSPPASVAPPRQRYDTILQTFGLCSVRDPVSLIATMAASVQPETGRIVLLEHGRSYWDLVNGLLDRTARGHFQRFGCWWNRDMEVIVGAAERAVPGLEVVRFERPGWVTMGTHVLVEMRVRAKEQDENAGKGKGKQDDEADEKTGGGWWSIIPSSAFTINKADEPRKG